MKRYLPLLLLVASCVGAARALDTAGQHGTQMSIGAVLGGLLGLVLPFGWVGNVVCGAFGALAALFSTPAGLPAPAGSPPPFGIPWGWLFLAGIAFLVYHRRRPLREAWQAARDKAPLDVIKALGAAAFGSKSKPKKTKDGAQ